MSLTRFYRHTATYTVGNLLYRGASFVLVPLYAHALAPADYGRLELITLTAFILQSVFSAGVAHSALRFYFEYDRLEDRNRVISTALIGSLLFAGTGGALFFLAAPAVARLVFGDAAFALAFRLIAITVVIEISREINLSYIRATERSRFFIVVALVQLVVQVAVTVSTVVYLHMGIIGVLIGNLVAALSIWVVLITSSMRICGFHLHRPTLTAIAKYGAPLMLSGLVVAGFQSIDRWALNSYATLEVLGIYALSLKIVNIIPMLVVTPFTNSYGPYRFAVMKQENAHEVYARILTGYVFVSTCVVIALGSVSREVLHILAAPEYWPAARVVPLLLIPAALSGVDYCFQTGIYIQKKTHYMLFGSLATGTVTVALILLLVPRFGAFGAALAGIGAAMYGVAQTCLLSRHVLPIRWEFSRILRIVAAGAVVEICALQIVIENPWQALALKACVLAFFPAIVGLLRVYRPEEIQIARALWLRLTAHLTLKHAAS